jgi:hypothetical protein
MNSHSRKGRSSNKTTNNKPRETKSYDNYANKDYISPSRDYAKNKPNGLNNKPFDCSKLDDIRSLKREILTMKHEELEDLNPDYVNELKDLARVVFSIFG